MRIHFLTASVHQQYLKSTLRTAELEKFGGDVDSKQILSFNTIKTGSPGSSEIINNINRAYFS